jgi:hypothetical protein
MATVTKIPVGNLTIEGGHQIMLLRQMTARFGVLHHLQVLNLKVWPSLYMGEKAFVQELRYDHENRVVELDLCDVDVKALNLSDGALKVDKAAKFLLGTDVRVKVIAGGQAIYDGGPQDDSWLSSTSPPKNEPSSKSGKKKRKSRVSRRR